MTEDFNSGLGCQETNPASGRVEALNLRPLDYNTSALNHPATLHREGGGARGVEAGVITGLDWDVLFVRLSFGGLNGSRSQPFASQKGGTF